MVVRTDSKDSLWKLMPKNEGDEVIYHMPISNLFDHNKWVTLFVSLLFVAVVSAFVGMAKRGRDFYIRPIAGLQEIDNAIGRATEMGRLCSIAWDTAPSVTLLPSSMGILGRVARRAANMIPSS